MNPIDLLDHYLENSPLAIIEWDEQFKVKRWSKKAETIFGWKQIEVTNFHPYDWQFIYVEDTERVAQVIDQLLNRKVSRNISLNRNYTKDGRVVYCEWYNSLLFTQQNNSPSILSLVLEVTENIELEQSLLETRQNAKMLLEFLDDAFIITDLNYKISYINYEASQITGFDCEEAKGLQLEEVFRLRNQSIERMINSNFEQKYGFDSLLSFDCDYHLISFQQDKPIEFTILPLYTKNKILKGYMLTFNHLDQRNNSLINRLKHQAERDEITGLFNRLYLQQELDKAINLAKTYNVAHCLCYLDLDRFQIINDTFGHIAGDKLLIELAELLEKELGDQTILARLGGDEFGILLLYSNLDSGYMTVQKIRDKIKKFNFVYENAMFKISASFGIVEINQDTDGSSLVLSAADVACFAAKEAGRNQIKIYRNSDEILEKMRSDRQWTIRINEGIKNKRFCLYQQKIEPAILGSENYSTHEILLRMIDEDGTLITPIHFIPAAERYGLMTDIDCLVIEMLVEYLQQEQINNNYYLVNLSGNTIGNQDFLDTLQELTNQRLLNPQHICFEITETAAISNLKLAVKFMETLKDMGFKFALDDFGAGMSSFNYLNSLPIDYLKIDGSFIKNIIDNQLNYTIVESIIKIAKVLKLKIIAEFVENKTIQTKIVEMGIDYVQGYGVHGIYPLSK